MMCSFHQLDAIRITLNTYIQQIAIDAYTYDEAKEKCFRHIQSEFNVDDDFCNILWSFMTDRFIPDDNEPLERFEARKALAY